MPGNELPIRYDPECPHCEKGMIYYEGGKDEEGRPHPEYAKRCQCALVWDYRANMESIWKGLSSAPRLQYPSPLLDHVDSTLWVTAIPNVFKSHLRYVAARQSPEWYARVITDADILDVWLRPIKVDGDEIFDRDIAATPIHQKREIADLVMPPRLLIVRVGVKAARNEAMPENLLDALMRREHAGLATWVFDQPGWALDHNHDHLCWSPQLQGYLSDWEHIELSKDGVSAPRARGNQTQTGPTADPNKALRDAKNKARNGGH